MQVILLTDNPSLVFQISSARPDWEVIEGLGHRIVLDPSGNTVGVSAFARSDRAVKAISTLDDPEVGSVEWVVAGDVTVSNQVKVVRSLARPFTLEDLLSATESAVGLGRLASPVEQLDALAEPQNDGQAIATAEVGEDDAIEQESALAFRGHPIDADKPRESLQSEDPTLIGKAIVQEIAEAYSPETIGLFISATDGFRILASKGLTRSEESRVVRRDHPLVREVCGLGQSLWLQPVDRAHGLVAGISGARTEALMAVPIVYQRHPIGMIVVGGFLQESQLHPLRAVAREAGRLLGDSLGLVPSVSG